MALPLHFPGPVGLTIMCVVAGVLYRYLQSFWDAKRYMLAMKKLGKPMPSWNLLFGTLLKAGDVYSRLPPSAHSCYMMGAISKDYPNGAFYFDVWPLMQPMLAVTDPAIANQVTSHPIVGARKPQDLERWFHTIAGGPSIITENGSSWKALRNMLNPGFSHGSTASHMPVILDEILIYRGLLRQKANKGDMFNLEPLALNLIRDIIGDTQLNIKLGSQKRSHPLALAMERQLAAKFTEYAPQNLFALINPVLMYRTWQNSRTLDSLIRAHLEKRLQAYKTSKAHGEAEKFKSVMDILIEQYMSQPGRSDAAELDAEFLAMATQNMRMFFFVGYDSTASVIIFCYYCIWKHPEVLTRMRAEHDVVFGAEINDSPRQIAENPAILDRLPYTQAVIKETMRHFPVANGVREGRADLELVDAEGNRYPTEGFTVVLSHYAIQMNPKYWARSTEFLPERFLVEPGHKLYPPRGGWRPFELGPRTCIGQDTVFAEIKAVLACTVREFDIRECYAEVDRGKGELDLSNVNGVRPYMIDAGAAHPVGKYPCRVFFSRYVPGGGS